METKQEEKITVNSLVDSTKVDSTNSLEGIIAFGNLLVKSQLVPHKNGSDVMACILMGKELGLGAMMSVNHIHCVNGRACPDVHIISTKLLQGGVIFKIVKDFQKIVRYIGKGGVELDKKDVDDNPHLYQLVLKTTPVTQHDSNKEQYFKVSDTYKLDGKDYFDIETSIYFERQVKQPDGTFKSMTHTQSFKWTDAIAQELTTKTNWVRMPRIMLYTRCFATGARFIADDLIMGVYELSEMADTFNVPYRIDESGNANPTTEVQVEKPVTNAHESVVFEEVQQTKQEEVVAPTNV